MITEDHKARVRGLVTEVFRETGKPLSENDPLVLVAVLFRATLDEWMEQNAGAFDRRIEDIEAISTHVRSQLHAAAAEVFDECATRSLHRLASDLDVVASQAVLKVQNAGARRSPDTPWKHRMEGFGIALATILFGALLLHFFGPPT